jgi:hypothetical protein
MPESELLLETLVWAVKRMRDLQRSVEAEPHAIWYRAMRAAEQEVDELVALHTLPEFPVALPPLVLPPEGGAL